MQTGEGRISKRGRDEPHEVSCDLDSLTSDPTSRWRRAWS